jgi:ATP citrate (pro-S)-lyase
LTPSNPSRPPTSPAPPPPHPTPPHPHPAPPQFFPATKYLSYAVATEEYTLGKAANLVLNVDGCIGALFLDLLSSSGAFTQKEMDDVISIGYLNGLFVLARSIGLIGHALDQKRLQQPLYRHPWESVLYVPPE